MTEELITAELTNLLLAYGDYTNALFSDDSFPELSDNERDCLKQITIEAPVFIANDRTSAVLLGLAHELLPKNAKPLDTAVVLFEIPMDYEEHRIVGLVWLLGANPEDAQPVLFSAMLEQMPTGWVPCRVTASAPSGNPDDIIEFAQKYFGAIEAPSEDWRDLELPDGPVYLQIF